MKMKMWCLATAVAAVFLADAPSANPQAGKEVESRALAGFNVRDFGATGNGKALDTAAIRKTIAAASAAGGGTVVFPPGVYVTGTFEMLSNVTLDVRAGAVIQGSSNLADYGSTAEYGFGNVYGVNSTGEGQKVGIILARNAENIAIIGQGAIDGNADTFYDFAKPHYGMDFDPQYTRQGKDFLKSMLELGDGPVETKAAGRPGTMIVLSHSKNILVRDITMRNAPNWTFHLAHSERIVVAGIHIVNSLLLPNNDGIDCIGCRDAHFSDCDIRAGDDDFAFYDAENVGITNCSLVSHSSGIRMENTRYSTFSNLSIRSNRGIGIYERAGITANVLFSNIAIETQLLTGHWWGKAEPIFIAVGPPKDGKTPEVHDVRFSNITGDAESGMVMYGDPKAWIHNLVLDGIHLRIRAPRKQAAELAGGNFDFRWTATDLSHAVFKHDTPGLYARYLEGFEIRGLSLEWNDDVPAYFSSAIECEDFRHVEIEGFSGREAIASQANAAIVLRRGDEVSVRSSQATAGTAIFLSATDVTREGLFVGNDLRQAKRVFAGEKSGFTVSASLMPGQN